MAGETETIDCPPCCVPRICRITWQPALRSTDGALIGGVQQGGTPYTISPVTFDGINRSGTILGANSGRWHSGTGVTFTVPSILTPLNMGGAQFAFLYWRIDGCLAQTGALGTCTLVSGCHCAFAPSVTIALCDSINCDVGLQPYYAPKPTGCRITENPIGCASCWLDGVIVSGPFGCPKNPALECYETPCNTNYCV
jgi:hypothetical protein